ncbi:hypothetical protein EST38_g312 [Candolleomyces aberdarensis]|uniref:GPI anchored protein n=1 Tax=Candolleomyces aberdarensis TaxID=2316362 RepID=A0A4Q2DZU1_9AGAR|nr:hypothetical protein EST38_g312 [Candolleomyces aberdarensis]
MKAFLAAAIALAVSGVSAQVTVNTPILPGNQPGAAALVDFGDVGDATQRTWLVNLPPSTIGINLRDSTGTLSQSAPFPIIAGTDDSCLNTTTTTSSRPTTSGTGTSSSTSRPTTTAPTTSTTSTTVTTPRPTTTVPTTTGTTPPTTGTSGGAAPLNTNAASKLSQAGFAGVAAAVAALLLA